MATETLAWPRIIAVRAAKTGPLLTQLAGASSGDFPAYSNRIRPEWSESGWATSQEQTIMRLMRGNFQGLLPVTFQSSARGCTLELKKPSATFWQNSYTD